ncbi:MAG: hypothetical protein ACFFD2_05850 [Promethearchaeota archaeon]
MDHKEELVNNLNNTILNFEESSQIVNYAILIEDEMILSPSATNFNKEHVFNIVKKLNIEQIEEIFQKGVVNLIHFEFKNEVIYYIRSTPKIKIIATLQKDIAKGAREKMINFGKQISSIVEMLSKLANKKNMKLQKAFDELYKIMNEFKIPKFEKFKRLVKFAIPFKKKS